MVEAPKPPQKLLPSGQESAGMSFMSNALAIAGFIILTFIIMWGVVHIASLSGFSFGSWLSSSPKVATTAPKNATSSRSITFPVLQPAAQKPTVQTPAPTIPKKTTSTYSYTAKRSGNYLPAGRQGNLVAHAASGSADLAVHIITVGVIDPGSGALINRPPMSPDDVVGVEFDIANIGGASTGAWYFQALLPIRAPSTYTSVAQISLKPGEHIVNTLRFSQAIPHGTFTVVVDPIGQVVESTKTNNQAATVI